MGDSGKALTAIIIIAVLFVAFFLLPSWSSKPTAYIIIPHITWNFYGNGSFINVTLPDGSINYIVDGVQTDYRNIPFSDPCTITLSNYLEHRGGTDLAGNINYVISFSGTKESTKQLGSNRTFLLYWLDKVAGVSVSMIRVYGLSNTPVEMQYDKIVYLSYSNGTLSVSTDKNAVITKISAESNGALNRMVISGHYTNPVYYTGGYVQIAYSFKIPQTNGSWVDRISDWVKGLVG